MLGGEGLRMELDAPDWELAMAQAHHETVFSQAVTSRAAGKVARSTTSEW